MILVFLAAAFASAAAVFHGEPDWLHFMLIGSTMFFAFRTHQWQRAEAEAMEMAVEFHRALQASVHRESDRPF